jgi:hypothetical protein
MKDVKSIVVTDDVVDHLEIDTVSNIDPGHDHAFAPHNRISQRFAIRTDDERYRGWHCFQQFFHFRV